MNILPAVIQRLIREFNKLPGIGAKTSERFVYHLLSQPKSEIDLLNQSLQELRDKIRVCGECYTFTENALCAICENTTRNRQLICVVAQPKDIFTLEKTGEFDGVYHVLGGVINQPEGIGPQHLRIPELLARIKRHNVTEVIFATNPDMEGETTALYITQQLKDQPLTITKIARGLPTGADIEFADETTLRNALLARQKM